MGIEMTATTDDHAIFQRDWAAAYVWNDVVGLYVFAEPVLLRARAAQLVNLGAATRASAPLPFKGVWVPKTLAGDFRKFWPVVKRLPPRPV